MKITAYDYTLYGAFEGRLESISPDAMTTEKGDTFYTIRVRTDNSFLERDGKRLHIMPGMMAEVDLLSGQKTVMAYLVKPLTRMRSEALRER